MLLYVVDEDKYILKLYIKLYIALTDLILRLRYSDAVASLHILNALHPAVFSVLLDKNVDLQLRSKYIRMLVEFVEVDAMATFVPIDIVPFLERYEAPIASVSTVNRNWFRGSCRRAAPDIMVVGCDFGSRLGAAGPVEVPTAVLWGMRDPRYSSDVILDFLNSSLAIGSQFYRLTRVEWAGHDLPIADPCFVGDEVAFFAQHVDNNKVDQTERSVTAPLPSTPCAVGDKTRIFSGGENVTLAPIQKAALDWEERFLTEVRSSTATRLGMLNSDWAKAAIRAAASDFEGELIVFLIDCKGELAVLVQM